jgi:hypothetical protein
MALPNHERAVVSEEKIVDYLLSATHRDGRHKAAFFFAFGFVLERWEKLASAILSHANENPVAKQELTKYGTRYVVEGTMKMADGRDALLRTVWFVETGEDVPRLVTAYPL